MSRSSPIARLARRVGWTITGISREIAGGFRLAADLPSFLRLLRDIFGYRAMRIFPFGPGRPPRTVRFKGGAELTYRMNRGDIRGMAETWIAGAYELPVELRARNIIDLGANIGTTSVWLARRYGASRLVAVEPAPGNAEVARINVGRIGIDAAVIEAAVASKPGTARFDVTHTSTWGRLSDAGIEVTLVTPRKLLEHFPTGEPIDLLKVDIEGGEQDVFSGDLDWLDRVRCIVLELHADRVDVGGVIGRIVECGFVHRDISTSNGYEGPHDVLALFVRD